MAFDVSTPSQSKKRAPLQPSMNVTPLVDVVLVLLIIFMVVTPLLTKHMTMNVPGKPQPDAPPPKTTTLPLPPVVLTLEKDGVLRINREPVARTEVVALLQRMLNARADKIVFFDASDDVEYGAAVEVLDLVRGGGIAQVAVVPEKVAN